MKGFLPSWWKWPVVFLSLVLVGFFVWQSGKYDQDIIVGKQESPSPLSLSIPPKTTKLSTGQTEARTPEELSGGLSAQSMEEIRKKLTEEREFAQSLQKETAEKLLSRLKTLWNATGGGPGASKERDLIKMALTQSLHSGDENSNAAVYQQLSALLRGDALPFTAKSEIASILGLIQTPQSVQLLLVEYQQATDAKLRERLGIEIARTGDNVWAGRFREDLSPPLEAAWPVTKNDPRLAQALANGLAKVGTLTGVQLLVNEVLRSAQTVESLSDLKDLQSQAAYLALEKIRNPNAIPFLSTGLLNANSSEVNQYVCGMSLAAMGRAEATQVLLQWAVTATDRDAAWAGQWFGKLRDTVSFDLVAAALNQANGLKFASVTIQNAVVLGQRNRER